MLRNIIFSLDFCYFKDISDKVTEDDDVIIHDDVTCVMTSSFIYCVDYYLKGLAFNYVNSVFYDFELNTHG